jgi:transcriptional pleiotropic regulator of transition state genes|tara:strand:+ start:543 stop:782 length:240 start_codon:yes stop_codon:yes gene_type:complete
MGKGNKGKIDNLGRIVIPKSIRDALGINHNDEISMTVENNKLIISKGYKTCSICNSKDITSQISDKFLCKSCVSDIKSL